MNNQTWTVDHILSNNERCADDMRDLTLLCVPNQAVRLSNLVRNYVESAVLAGTFPLGTGPISGAVYCAGYLLGVDWLLLANIMLDGWRDAVGEMDHAYLASFSVDSLELVMLEAAASKNGLDTSFHNLNDLTSAPEIAQVAVNRLYRHGLLRIDGKGDLTITHTGRCVLVLNQE